MNRKTVAALKGIGKPPAATVTLTATPLLMPEITKEIPDEEEPQEETQTEEDIETPVETKTSNVATLTVTPASAGFGIVVSLVGLFVCALLVKKKNK